MRLHGNFEGRSPGAAKDLGYLYPAIGDLFVILFLAAENEVTGHIR
jgi:hypothetical protein